MYDVIIIGAGPAGISASLYTKRAGYKTLIIYNNESSLKYADKIDNYYGFENEITGNELYNRGIKQAKNLGVELLQDEVVSLEYNDVNFKVSTLKNTYESKIVILATGIRRNKPKIKGIDEFEGKGISYCAICDGFFYKNKNVSVIGNGNYAISELMHLLNVADKVTLLTNGKEAPLFRAENLSVIDKKIEGINGDTKVRSVEFSDNTTIDIDGVFIAEGVASSTDLASRVGAFTNKNNIIVDENMKTNVNGLYACGDATGGLLQISKAVYEGAKAGISIIKYLQENSN